LGGGLSGGRSTNGWEDLGGVQAEVIKCTNEKREPSGEGSLQNTKFCSSSKTAQHKECLLHVIETEKSEYGMNYDLA